MSEKIAVIVDSGSNLNNHLIDGTSIQSIPLRINVDGKDYVDGVDIDLDGVFAVLDNSKVTTSLPTGADIVKQLEDLKSKDYTHVIVVTISSGLSGTYNVINNLSTELEALTVHVVDTKNISVGAGLYALEVYRRVQEGQSFESIISGLDDIEARSKVFFTIGTLEYLKRGGRIGLVAGTVADVLNIKPIITCNDEGIYHTVSKVRGFSRAIKAMVDKAAAFAGGEPCRLVLLDANHNESREAIMDYVRSKFDNIESLEMVKVSPALGIHVGPVACGLGVYKI